MISPRTKLAHSNRRSRGSALIVGLIMLLLITLLAVTGMRNTILQERMAGNMYDRSLAFQASESATRAGEQWLENNNLTPLEFADPLVDLISDNQLRSWDGSNATGTHPDLNPGADLSLAADPAFHVGPPQRKRVGHEIPPTFVKRYPVTARGVGGTADSVVIVQSVYEPITQN